MKPEAQRRAIAEACGWTRKKTKWGFMWFPPNEKIAAYEDDIECLPDYLECLNAIHEAEGYAKEHLMDGDEWEQFGRELEKVHPTACVQSTASSATKSPIDYYDLATLITELKAKHRAEALLRSIGKWRE